MLTKRLIVAAALGVTALALVACTDSTETEAVGADESAVINVYEVRGRVMQVPSPTEPNSEFQVYHEAIPAFKANANETEPTGMNAMAMPFPIGETLSLEGIEVGDIVRLSFMVEYDPETGDLMGWEATEVEELAPDTELTFSKVPTDMDDIDAAEADWLTGQGGDEPAFQDEPGAEPEDRPNEPQPEGERGG
jgi:hypothetical protein